MGSPPASMARWQKHCDRLQMPSLILVVTKFTTLASPVRTVNLCTFYSTYIHILYIRTVCKYVHARNELLTAFGWSASAHLHKCISPYFLHHIRAYLLYHTVGIQSL